MFVTGERWQEDDHIDKICLSWSPLQSRPSVSHADPANVKHGLDVKSVWSPDCLGLGKMLHTLTLECCEIELWFSGGQRPKPSAKCTRWFFAASFVRSQGPRITSNPPYSQKGPMGWKLFIASHQLQEGDYLQPKVGAKSRPKNALHSASAGKGFSNRGSFGQLLLQELFFTSMKREIFAWVFRKMSGTNMALWRCKSREAINMVHKDFTSATAMQNHSCSSIMFSGFLGPL